MKLAEALILRSDTQKRYNAVQARAQAVARHQEGEEPPEDANLLLAQAEEMLDELEGLIRRINLTNASATLEDGRLVTAAIAQRDVLKFRRNLMNGVADAGSGSADKARQMRSELRYVSAVPVSELRDRANELARKYRELDTQIQEANWRVELVEE
ncbi:MAG: DIP1984 family protein [Acidimicrobiales bacterium]|jgi:hypothetical protein